MALNRLCIHYVYLSFLVCFLLRTASLASHENEGSCSSCASECDESWSDGFDEFVGTMTFYKGMPVCKCLTHCTCPAKEWPMISPRVCCSPYASNYRMSVLWHRFVHAIWDVKAVGPIGLHWDRFVIRGVTIHDDAEIHDLSDFFEMLSRLQQLMNTLVIENKRFAHELYPDPKDKAQYDEMIARHDRKCKAAMAVLQPIPEMVVSLYSDALKNCPHTGVAKMAVLYELGQLGFLQGNSDDALHSIQQYISLAEQHGFSRNISSQHYQICGESYLEMSRYPEAIAALTKAIAKDPKNREAYFHRAAAYFETGDFDRAVEDYLASGGTSKTTRCSSSPSKEFTAALLEHAARGVTDAATDFVPSLCQSAYGLAQAVWTTAQHPIESTQNFAGACYEMGECIVEYCKTVDWDTVGEHVEQIRTLYEKYDQLSDAEKGALVGYAVGKYGVDLFAGGAAIKGVAAFRNLRNANRVCNLETMTLSAANKESLVGSSLKHAAQRENYFKSVKIHADRQGKHIIGKHNYEPDKYRSILTHNDPQDLLKNFAGKGVPKNKYTPGISGYVERVDFQETIGYYISEKKPNIKIPTTKGTIKYSKDGAHIVPSHPDG